VKEPRKSVEEDWDEFWQPIIAPDGEIDVEQLKKELSDFRWVMEQVPKVYMHITGGTLSKVMYEARTVITYADDECTKICNEAVAEETKELRELCAAALLNLETLGFKDDEELCDDLRAALTKAQE
jgi:hypothetical protein